MEFCQQQITGLQCPRFLVGQILCRSGGWCRSSTVSRQAAALLPPEKQHWFGPHFFACQPGLHFKWAAFECLAFPWESCSFCSWNCYAQCLVADSVKLKFRWWFKIAWSLWRTVWGQSCWKGHRKVKGTESVVCQAPEVVACAGRRVGTSKEVWFDFERENNAAGSS